ncbi:MAG: hypothetical protein NTU88_12740 [Armatimonadetes bacterium]|nr:hypothetical protein [Armatimonadota bacterium]
MRRATARTRMALLFAHPHWIAAGAIAGACLAIEYGLDARMSAAQMRLSILAALAIGLPAVVWTKRLMRRHIEFYAEYSLQLGGRAAQIAFWRSNWKYLLISMPLVLALCAVIGVCERFGIPCVPALGMVLILCVLLYPEQEEVYRRIRAKIAEKANNDSGV